MVSTQRFDLIILCHTLTEYECRHIIEFAAAQKRRPRVLLLTWTGIQGAEPGPGDTVMSDAGPYYLLKKSAEMLGVDIRVKAKLVEA